MNDNIIASIDQEIARLQKAKALLSGLPELSSLVATGKRRGRPPGSGKTAVAPKAAKAVKAAAKRTMSAEGKARIAAAQKKRWAAQKAA